MKLSSNNKQIKVSLIYIAFLLPVLYLLQFEVSGKIASFIVSFVNSPEESLLLKTDALISFLILFFTFIFVTNKKSIHSNIVIAIMSLSMFIYWGIESEFFWNGINPTFTLWYELNMAFNDVVAALLAFLVCRSQCRPAVMIKKVMLFRDYSSNA